MVFIYVIATVPVAVGKHRRTRMEAKSIALASVTHVLVIINNDKCMSTIPAEVTSVPNAK